MTAQQIAELFARIELMLIASLRRNLSTHKAWEKGEGFSWPAWQAEVAKNLDTFRRENRAIMAEYRPVIDAETEKLLQEQFDEGIDAEAARIREIAPERGRTVPDSQFFGMNKGRLENLIKDMQDTERRAESAALRLMDDVYRRVPAQAELAMASGAVTLPQAVDMATKSFLEAGVNCITYQDGRRVNIASYAEMALRTAATRAQLQGEAQKRMELGIDTVLVSQYGACSETCLPWQGRVYIDDVWAAFQGERSGDYGKSRDGKSYPLLSVAIRNGLFHPNCRHTLTTWIDGISRKPPPLDAEKVRRAAALERQQRALERDVRKYKRLREGAEEAEKRREYDRKVKDAQKRLSAFVKEHKDILRRDPWREHDMLAESRRQEPQSEKDIRILPKKLVNASKVPEINDKISEPPVDIQEEHDILEEKEVAAVTRYVGGDAYALNAKLREGIPLNEQEQELAQSLDAALEKLPVYQGEAIRYLKFDTKDQLRSFVSAHGLGKQIMYPAYTSATTTDGYMDAPTIALKIQSHTGRDIRSFNERESEILFRRGSKFIAKEMKLEDKIPVITMEEVNTDDI